MNNKIFSDDTLQSISKAKVIYTQSSCADLWGIVRSKYFDLFVLLITLSFVALEAVYNIDLLNVISDPSANQDSVGDLSRRGKILAAFGITWAVGKSLLTYIRPFTSGLIAFSILTACTYQALDYTYAKVINGLDPEIKVKGFGLFSYRRDLLKEDLIDKDIPLPKNNPVVGKIFMGAFPMVLLDDRYMLPVIDTMEFKADYKEKEVLEKGEDAWPKYNSYMSELRSAHKKFIKKSIVVLDPNYAEREWQKHIKIKRKISYEYDRFINGSKKALKYGDRGRRIFIKKSGGLSPNPRLSRSEFISLLKSSRHPDGRKLRVVENREIGMRLNGDIVYGRDIPESLSKGAFLRFIRELVSETFKAKGFKKPNKNISRNRFVELLRDSNTTEGRKIRNMESRVITTRPDGSKVYMREIPYFLDRKNYVSWVTGKAREERGRFLPTIFNVHKFSRINDINSAVFLPPMAIMTSLISALTNAVAIAIIVIGFGIVRVSGRAAINETVTKYSPLIVIIVVSAIIYNMPTHVFDPGTPIFELETKLHKQVGLAGEVWSRLSNLQKLIL